MTPQGDAMNSYDNTCSGDVSNFNGLSHECRVDTGDTSSPVLTFQYVYNAEYGNAVDSGLCDIQEDLCEDWIELYGDDADVGFAGMALVKWDRESSDDPTTLYDLFDYFSPHVSSIDDDPNFTLMAMRCTGMADSLYAGESHRGVFWCFHACRVYGIV